MRPLSLRLRPELIDELHEVVSWYNAANPGLGAEFQNVFFAEIDRVAADLIEHRCVFLEFRRIVMRRFPYLTYFSIEGDTAVIVMLAHSARNPAAVRQILRAL